MESIRLIALVAAAACGGRSMIPQTSATSTSTARGDVPPAQRYPATLLSHLADSIAVARATGATFRNEPTYKVIEGRRWESGGAEIHDDWTDVMIVQSGRARVITGGHLDAPRVDSPGELRSTSIIGGTPQTVMPGDVVVIPAGTPHQTQLAPGDSIRYLTIKIPKATK